MQNQFAAAGSYLAGVVLVHNPATASLLVFLSSAWPRWAILFQGLISLDMASHYMHMYAGHVQADETLEEDSPSGPGGAQED
jgi:hypothetical protein